MNNAQFKQVVKEQKVNITQFAKKIGKSPVTIHRWLNGSVEIPKTESLLLDLLFQEGDKDG